MVWRDWKKPEDCLDGHFGTVAVNIATKNILITGRPGIGKTTLIKRIADQLGPQAGGFYTEEIRRGPERMGFKVRNLDGVEGILAHKDIKSNQRVGKYGVDVDEFERVALPAIRCRQKRSTPSLGSPEPQVVSPSP